MVANDPKNVYSVITDLRVYPVKSCRRVSVRSTTLTKSGLKYDRRWMFVNEKNLHQSIREKPEMTLIIPDFDDDTNELFTEVRVPLEPTAEWIEANMEKTPAKIFHTWTGAFYYTDPKLLQIFEDFFGYPVKLVMKDPGDPRVPPDNGRPEILGRLISVDFPDGQPLLIASETSLAELNERMVEKGLRKLTYDRFRPNIIISGGDPWSEDEWKTVRINGAPPGSWLSSLTAGYLGNGEALDIDIASRCPRCLLPNVDPYTGVRDKHQPWDMLMKYRRIDKGAKWVPCVGMLGCPRNEGRIEVGMRFEVLAFTKEHKFVGSG
ncbi:hypothetical protein DV735_g5545, partial [Chaetothyriales sp. CBS 134920]